MTCCNQEITNVYKILPGYKMRFHKVTPLKLLQISFLLEIYFFI